MHQLEDGQLVMGRRVTQLVPRLEGHLLNLLQVSIKMVMEMVLMVHNLRTDTVSTGQGLQVVEDHRTHLLQVVVVVGQMDQMGMARFRHGEMRRIEEWPISLPI